MDNLIHRVVHKPRDPARVVHRLCPQAFPQARTTPPDPVGPGRRTATASTATGDRRRRPATGSGGVTTTGPGAVCGVRVSVCDPVPGRVPCGCRVPCPVPCGSVWVPTGSDRVGCPPENGTTPTGPGRVGWGWSDRVTGDRVGSPWAHATRPVVVAHVVGPRVQILPAVGGGDIGGVGIKRAGSGILNHPHDSTGTGDQ